MNESMSILVFTSASSAKMEEPFYFNEICVRYRFIYFCYWISKSTPNRIISISHFERTTGHSHKRSIGSTPISVFHCVDWSYHVNNIQQLILQMNLIRSFYYYDVSYQLIFGLIVKNNFQMKCGNPINDSLFSFFSFWLHWNSNSFEQ